MRTCSAEFYAEPLGEQVRRAQAAVEAARTRRRIDRMAMLLAADLVDARARASASSWAGMLTAVERIREGERARAALREERQALVRSNAQRLASARSNTRVTAEQVRQIRQRLAEGARQCDVAREFGVSGTTVADIRYRRTWQEVE